jgi:large conductance mechanosensitive channel
VLPVLSDFRSFLVKSNALALAIGVIIGAALGGVVDSLVKDIIMPPVGLALGGIDFSQLAIHLKDATTSSSGAPVAAVDIRYGAFLNTIIAFVIIAFVAFWLGRMFIREEEAEPAKQCPFCREDNKLDATKCRACASAI